MSTPFYRAYLKSELGRRARHNPRYSLRTFARALGLNPGSLSRVLSGERPLSPRAANGILGELALTRSQRARFLESIFEEKKDLSLRRITPEVWREPPPAESRPVDNDLFRIIGDWYHSAILELTFADGFRPEARWIADALGISPGVAKKAVDRLLSAGLLRWSGGTLMKTARSTTTRNKELTSFHLRRHTTQLFQKAIRSFHEVPIEERSSTGMTMAIDPRQLPLARRLIEEFTQEMVRALETGRQRRVYHLGIALFPLQRATPESPRSDRASPPSSKGRSSRERSG